jgi:hypothetical protein
VASINMLRGLLVAGAVLAAVVAAAYQQWAAVFILMLGVLAHLALWVRLHREREEAQRTGGQPPAASAP